MADRARFLLPLLAACQPDLYVGGRVDVAPDEITACGFTPVSGTRLSRYDCNPVFSDELSGEGSSFGEFSIFAQPVLDHAIYQMWFTTFTGNPNRPYRMNYAVSADGVAWEPDPRNPVGWAPAAWDAGKAQLPSILWDPVGREYVAAYQGFDLAFLTSEFGLRTSPDGQTWSPTDSSPLFSLASPVSGKQMCWPLAFTQAPDASFRGFLAGAPADEIFEDSPCEPYPISADDVRRRGTWALGRDPILTAGRGYDRYGMAGAAVVVLDGTWYLFYVAVGAWDTDPAFPGSRFAANTRLALATSPDGRTWTKSDENPFPVGVLGEGAISSVAAQVVGPRIHLWVGDAYGGDVDDQAVGYFYYEPDVEPHDAP